MESVIKAYTGIFFILILAVLGYGLLAASIDARNADSFAADCVVKIENSNYSQAVIDACKEDAQRQGYQLEVDIFGRNGQLSGTGGKLKLNYKFEIDALDIVDERTVSCFLR